MRIAFVTTDDVAFIGHDPDLPHHRAAFAALGVDLDLVAWRDPAADWAGYDLVVIRSPWDYHDRLDDFLPWLASVRDLPTLHNPGPLIEWNLDKRYLGELGAAGVPVVPTTFAADEAELDDALATGTGSGVAEVVVKPTVSAGSRNTGRFAAGDPAASRLGREILGLGREVMVQPAIPSVADRGEAAIVVIDGQVSHAFRKGPILARGGTFVEGDYHEDISPLTADGPAAELAVAAVDVVHRLVAERGWLPAGTPLLYGRYDVVTLPDGSAALLEAELFEPAFYLPAADGAADRFARAVVERARA